MSQRRPRLSRAVSHDISTLGSAAVSLGAVAVVATLPVVIGVGAAFLSGAATVDSALALALSALDEPLVGAYSTAWLFHVAVAGLLGGTWVLGAGLVLEGLFE